MPARLQIDDREFADLVLAEPFVEALVGKVIFDRLPYAFDDSDQYLNWRHSLAQGLRIDARDIVVVGSRATGRSLNPYKHFRPMKKRSDLDLAIVSRQHFNEGWAWFKRTKLAYLSLDERGRHLFEQHRRQYIFDGFIASDFFLASLPFGTEWVIEIQKSEKLLPPGLQGRPIKVRIYRDNESLRMAQAQGLASFKRHLQPRKDGKE